MRRTPCAVSLAIGGSVLATRGSNSVRRGLVLLALLLQTFQGGRHGLDRGFEVIDLL